MDPITGSLILGGASALGNIFGASSARKDANKDRAEQRREFDLGYGLQKSSQELGQRDLERTYGQQAALAPMRQQVLASLMARLGIGGPPVAAPPLPSSGMHRRPSVDTASTPMPTGAAAAAPPPPGAASPTMASPTMASPTMGGASMADAGSEDRILQLARALGVRL